MKSKIDEVRVAAWKWGEELEPPAKSCELDDFEARLINEYSMRMPRQYRKFLEIVDGLEFNGLIIFGTKNSKIAQGVSNLDFFEMNDIFRGSTKDCIPDIVYVGEDSTGVLTYDKELDEFQYRDRIGLDRVDSFESFEDMFNSEIDKVMA